jgi:hypothetical protein
MSGQHAIVNFDQAEVVPDFEQDVNGLIKFSS